MKRAARILECLVPPFGEQVRRWIGGMLILYGIGRLAGIPMSEGFLRPWPGWLPQMQFMGLLRISLGVLLLIYGGDSRTTRTGRLVGVLAGFFCIFTASAYWGTLAWTMAFSYGMMAISLLWEAGAPDDI